MSDVVLEQFIVDSPMCAECQGKCCKRCPGECYPIDVVPMTVERIVQMVRHERYAIDWYIGDPRPDGDLDEVYYVRPAIVGAVGHVDPSWGGRCVFLGHDGCSLSPKQRPTACLAMIPSDPVDGHCETVEGYQGKEAAALAWISYQDIIGQAAHELG